MGLAEMLLRGMPVASFQQVIALRTERQLAELEGEVSPIPRAIIDSANEIYFMYQTQIEEATPQTLRKVIDDLITIDTEEIHPTKVVQMQPDAPYHSLALDIVRYAYTVQEEHSRFTYIHTLREVIKGICERNRLEYPQRELTGKYTGEIVPPGAGVNTTFFYRQPIDLSMLKG